MKWIALLLSLYWPFATGQLRGRRSLSERHPHFMPLDCPCETITTWSASFNDDSEIIPCGHCVEVDVPSIHLSRGLDVQGELTIKNDLSITTPFLIVQGVLRVYASGPVTSVPHVHIQLIGDDPISFQPQEPNTWACSPMDAKSPVPCDVSAKAIVVAGGRVDIDGFDDSCRTWVKLHSIVSQLRDLDLKQLPELAEDCPVVYMDESFTDSGHAWSGGVGADHDVRVRGKMEPISFVSCCDDTHVSQKLAVRSASDLQPIGAIDSGSYMESTTNALLFGARPRLHI